MQKHSLTAAQARFMLGIQKLILERGGYSPSYQEIMDELGYASKSEVSRLIEVCELRGRIKRIPGMARTINIINPLTEDEAGAQDANILLSVFSDQDLIHELRSRGLNTG